MSSPRAIPRRTFLRTAAAGVASTAASLATTGRAAVRSRRPKDRPNILVIMSDEHNAGVTGCYGSPIVRTPNLDRLAERGIALDGCYCNSPLCVPSRMSFTAGKYVSRTGAWNNSCWLPSDEYPSIARVMTAAGYDSLLCGKMHYDRTRRYGFTEIGGMMNGSFKTGTGGRRKPDDLPESPTKISARFQQFYAADDSSILTHDRNVTAGVTDFLQKRKRSERPFFLFAGYLAPHFPLIVPQPYWDPYHGKVPMPEIPPGHLDSLPLNYKHLRAGFQVIGVPDEITRKGRELYHGLTQWFDDQVGIVLKTLGASDAADNTVVVYTSDHGENVGEHGLWWKNCMYQHAARVPCLVSWPERWTGGERRSQACSMVDLVQTIAELGGAETPDDWNGDSMCSWMDDPDSPWRDLAVSEYYAHNIASGYAMLRSGDYKYVYHSRMDESHPPERELYDLKADPGEFRNLARDPGQRERIETMHAALVQELGEEPDETELRCRADYAKGYGRAQPGKGKSKKTRKKQTA
ncbi:MAG TPA: sulfatase-like hydrolase/transferase [Thermoguttaceae bacterium]|nr:sulfatase-like hydrolase/transferase [Thermoguttaceae bacterium]